MKISNELSILLAFTINLHLVPSSNSQSPVAIHPDRNALLEKALSWLTLRKDGNLLTPGQSVPFLEQLRKDYRQSRQFRAVTISFLYGLLPRLTLGKGATCESAYPARWRNQFNDTFTWDSIKDITQKSYTEPGNFNQAYCNYREGLLCNPTTNKCECPEGSKMGPIDDKSSEERCQMEEDQPCALADLAISSKNKKLTGKLHEMIFNLEKPLSCVWGTQCQYKGSRFTKCISSSQAPFDSTIPDLNYGEECVLDYIGEKGGCQTTSIFYDGATCYNFWGFLKNKTLPSSWVDRRMSFCAMDMAPYVTPGITYLAEFNRYRHSIGYTDYFIPDFVNPRTVKMSSSDLINYDKELHQLTQVYRDNRREIKEGKPCSVADTDKMKEIWKFYESLEGNSPQGDDFVADEATLNAKLVEYKNLLGNKNQPKICHMNWEFTFELSPNTIRYPMICEASGNSPDADGNDGRCVILKDGTEKQRFRDHANKQLQMFRDNGYIRGEYHSPDYFYDKGILWNNPDKECTQTLPVQNRKGQLFDRGDVLEDGTCPDDRYFCMEDLSDPINIYVDPPSDCNFIPNYVPKYACFDVVTNKIRYELDKCEIPILIERNKMALETASKLGRGAECDYETELAIKEYLSEEGRRYVNGYRILRYLQTRGICDSSKLLNCSTGNTCDCIENTEVRKSANGMYSSDYCYLTSGNCNVDVTKLVSLQPEEAKAALLHYGDPGSVGTDCSNGNICKFIDPKSNACTAVNTGKTGVDVESTGAGGGGKPLKPPTPFSGAETALKQRTYSGLVISMIVVVFSCLYQ